MDIFRQITQHRAIALDFRRKLVSVLYLTHFVGRLPSNFVCELIFKRSGLRLKMDTFPRISTGLLSLICVENLYPRNISRICWPIVFQLCI